MMVHKMGQSLKFAAVFILIFCFCITSLLVGLLFFLPPWKKQKLRARVLSFFCKKGLRVLRVKLECVGWVDLDLQSSQPQLYVSNHMSYLDILVLSALYPSSYVTSIEIKEMPFIGKLTVLAGCLYVERRSKEDLSKEVSQLRDALTQGLSVTIFPEATSTNGEEVLRFRSPLYLSAIQAKVLVQPLCLNYTHVSKSTFSKGNRDLVCWYGDMDFLPHLWKLCGANGVKARVHFLDPVAPLHFHEPKHLAEITYETVRRHFQPAL